MLTPVVFEKATRAAQVPSTQSPRGYSGDSVFPFQGVIPTGLFAPPFVWDYLSRDHGTAWKGLDLRANLIAGLEWYTFKYNAKGEEVRMPPDYWSEKFVNNLASELDDRTGFEIRKLIFKWGILSGNAYSLAVCSGADGSEGMPQSLWPMEPNNITTIAVTKEYPITQFRYTTPRGVYTYPYWRVWHFRRSEPTPYFQWNLLYGIPEFSKYGDVIDTETQALVAQDADLRNNSMPNFLLKQAASTGLLGTPDMGTQEANIQLFRRQWLQERTGAQNAGKMAILPVGWEAQVLSKGDRESPFLQTMQMLRNYIATMQGTPLTMMDGTYNSRAAAEVVSEYFFKNQVEPDAVLMRGSLSKFLGRFEDGLQCGFVSPLRMPFDERRLAVETLAKIPGAINGNIAGGILFGNEYEETETGDVFTVPMGTTTMDAVMNPPDPNGGEPTKPSEPVADTASGKKKDASGQDESRKKLWAAKDTLAQSGVKRAAKKMQPVWDSLVESITAKLPSGDKAYGRKAGGVGGAIEFDVDEWAAKLWAATKGTYYDVCKQAIMDALEEIGDNITPNWANEVVEATLKELVGKITTEPLTTLKDSLEELFTKAMAEGKDVSEISDLIREKVGGLPKWKSDQVAQTTVTPAVNGAQLGAWKKAGIGKKEWLSRRDGDVREQHEEMDGQIRDVDKDFAFPAFGKCKASSGKAPGYSPQACSSINCRCYMRAMK